MIVDADRPLGIADLRRCTEDDIERIAAAASETGSVAIEGQHLTADELERFVGRLGPLMFTPGETPLAGTDFVFEVTNRDRIGEARSVFHTDTSYVETPPSFSVLSAVTVPTGRQGGPGDTIVIDQRDATRSLPDDLRERLLGVEVLHVASRVPDPSAAGDGAWHPVLRHHPDLDETVLYLSARERMVAVRLNGERLTDAVADDLLDAVWSVAMVGQSHRHRWSCGDVLVLDNRVGLHRAEHGGIEGERTLHRVMCRGERPAAAT